ncbi:putative F-box protein At1g50870 isoform X1 [Brachypodium distachyon]|uniref:F-box domain-containing protein n=2 Tax=Brachypodium distachyon TaxID=15368 RepID=I1GLW4_BRADI|nr:putative F-box protein At1g50870 isoform X1 [Brachypodium distachyon]PNT73948.1 hypothetical protein BRADI_1g04677v3 [Brachypodium distachyon]|eukprot:XP_024313119.1 putative F-box protein At1g50870 isoform X1 [Brachypodium distachyon]
MAISAVAAASPPPPGSQALCLEKMKLLSDAERGRVYCCTQRDMETKLEVSMSSLTDDLIVEILSRLPVKSFCRFQCVCKSWLAFSSDPHYRQKLSRTPFGFLYQTYDDASFHLARLPSSDREIYTILGFVRPECPLDLVDCSNGLLLCYPPDDKPYITVISDAFVCNPATQEWMALPKTVLGPAVTENDLILCFDPLWSQHFYVFNFQRTPTSVDGYSTEVKVFFSEDSTWSCCLWETEDLFCGDSCFINGVLYVRHFWDHELLVLNAPEVCTQWLNDRIIQLPGFPYVPETFNCFDGCICPSSGVLCYAQQELDGYMLRIWSLEDPDRWVVKHRLSMVNVFGRDMLLRANEEGLWYFDYDIQAFDLERELVILVDRIDDRKGSFSISAGKGSQIQNIPSNSKIYHRRFYVPYYGKIPAFFRRDDDGLFRFGALWGSV